MNMETMNACLRQYAMKYFRSFIVVWCSEDLT